MSNLTACLRHRLIKPGVLKPRVSKPGLLLLAWLFSLPVIAGPAVATFNIATLNIVTTVPPLQFIALAVTGEQGNVRAIMDQQDTPHHFTLSPGDRLVLEEADLVLWLGPSLEQQLSQFIASPAMAGKALTAMDITGITLHRLSSGGGGSGASDRSGETDPHLWLDPGNAGIIAAAIANKVSELDPDNAALYRRNLTEFEQRLEAADANTGNALSDLQYTPYVVYHDAYQYFEKHTGLSHALALVHNPEVAPGMREVLRLRQQLNDLEPVCVIMEPDSNPALVDTLLPSLQGGNETNRQTIDLLGYAIVPGPTAYMDLLASVTAGFRQCLSNGP